jgi:hypothetical protein
LWGSRALPGSGGDDRADGMTLATGAADQEWHDFYRWWDAERTNGEHRAGALRFFATWMRLLADEPTTGEGER